LSASPRAGSLPLVGGALALDFSNTTTGRGTDAFVEHLFDYEDLLRWAAHAAILSPAEAARLAATPATEAEAAFGRAMAVRALLNGIFDRIATGKAPRESDLAELARLYAETWREAALIAADGGFRWCFERTVRADAVLVPIVQSARWKSAAPAPSCANAPKPAARSGSTGDGDCSPLTPLPAGERVWQGGERKG
jgi:predicted RNA-binding Zn ribbon-like protein